MITMLDDRNTGVGVVRDPAPRLLELASQRGDDGESRRWASELLERDAMLRLDPLRQLTEQQRRRVESLAESP